VRVGGRAAAQAHPTAMLACCAIPCQDRMHACTRMCTHARTHTRTHTYTHAHTHTNTQTHAHAHAHTHTRTCSSTGAAHCCCCTHTSTPCRCSRLCATAGRGPAHGAAAVIRGGAPSAPMGSWQAVTTWPEGAQAAASLSEARTSRNDSNACVVGQGWLPWVSPGWWCVSSCEPPLQAAAGLRAVGRQVCCTLEHIVRTPRSNSSSCPLGQGGVGALCFEPLSQSARSRLLRAQTPRFPIPGSHPRPPSQAPPTCAPTVPCSSPMLQGSATALLVRGGMARELPGSRACQPPGVVSMVNGMVRSGMVRYGKTGGGGNMLVVPPKGATTCGSGSWGAGFSPHIGGMCA